MITSTIIISINVKPADFRTLRPKLFIETFLFIIIQLIQFVLTKQDSHAQPAFFNKFAENENLTKEAEGNPNTNTRKKDNKTSNIETNCIR